MVDVIVLAGGYAERLWPLTETFPKALLNVAGCSALHHVIENLRAIANVGKVVIAIDAARADVFNPIVNDLSRDAGIKLQVSAHKERQRGKIKSPVEKIAEILDNASDFSLQADRLLVVGADNIFGFPLSRFIEFQSSKGGTAIAIHRRATALDAADFGVPTLDRSGKVVSFEEKPTMRCCDLISTACYLLPLCDAALVHEFLMDKEADDTLGSLIAWLQTRKPIDGYSFDDEWFDIGTRDGILSANRFLIASHERYRRMPHIVRGSNQLSDLVFIGDGVTIQDSIIGPSVYIAKNSRIIRSSIENSIVYEGARLVDCELRDSVVGSGSVVEGRVSEAVFGPKTMIVRG